MNTTARSIASAALAALLTHGALVGAAGAALAVGTWSAPAAADETTAVAAADDTLYQALGGTAGIRRLTDDFLARLQADGRMKRFFADVDDVEFKRRLAEQFCQVAGGPCTYGGKSMKNSHEELDIGRTDFNALVEVLQDSMSAQGIAFGAQNRLLARLAPMHREIVNRP